MKLRIENDSIRFRITDGELVRLNERGRLEASTRVFSPDGTVVEGEFIYALTVDSEGGPTRCLIEPSYIMFIIHPDDLALLNNRGGELCYRREATLPSGEIHSFTARAEIDRHRGTSAS